METRGAGTAVLQEKGGRCTQRQGRRVLIKGSTRRQGTRVYWFPIQLLTTWEQQSPVIRGCLRKLKRIIWHGIGMTSKSESIFSQDLQENTFFDCCKEALVSTYLKYYCKNRTFLLFIDGFIDISMNWWSEWVCERMKTKFYENQHQCQYIKVACHL